MHLGPLILRSVFTLRAAELSWVYRDGASRLLPERWAEFTETIPPGERHDLVGAYRRRLASPDEQVRVAAALAWTRWETAGMRADPTVEALFAEPRFAVAFARIESHYISHAGFLAEGQLICEASLLAGIPAVAGHELEEQVRGFGFERDVADLVDDEQGVAAQAAEFVLEPAGLAGPDRQAGREVGLAGAGRAEQQDVLLRGDEVQRARWAMRSRLRPRAWSKSNSSRLLREGNRAARIRPSPPWLSRAETSRCRQATRNSSWVQDSALARSTSRGTASRSVGAFRARVRNATSAVKSRLCALPLAAARALMRHHPRPARRHCRCQCRRRSGQARCRSPSSARV